MAEREFQREFQRNSIRLFALRHGYYHALPEEKGKVYTRFETSGPGALFQHDSSQHLWVPCLGERQSVILTQDDYSRKVLPKSSDNCLKRLFILSLRAPKGCVAISLQKARLLRFTRNDNSYRWIWVLGAIILERETTASHLVLTRQVIERYGLPFAYYVDNHSIFRFVERESRHYICEKKKIKTVKDAQTELDELVAFYNDCRVHQETEEIPSQRWNKAVEKGKGKGRPLSDSVDIDWVFSLHYERWDIKFSGKRVQDR